MSDSFAYPNGFRLAFPSIDPRGTGELCAAQVCAFQICIFQIGSSQISLDESGFAKIRILEIYIHEIGATEPRHVKSCAVQIRISKS